MAKVKGLGLSLPIGKTGPVTTFLRAGELNMRQSASKVNPNRKPSEAEMKARMLIKNPVALWKCFNGKDKPSFEALRPGQTDYNLFYSCNRHIEPVYVTKEMTRQGACVLTHALVSAGSLPTINITRSNQVAVSDLQVGTLAISATTRVSDFSAALLNANKGYAVGDCLACFVARQTVNSETGFPEVTISGSRVRLDPNDTALLNTIVDLDCGFHVTDGRLSFDCPTSTLGTYIHARPNEGDNLHEYVSTQYFVGDNPLIDVYSGTDAFAKASDSYGGYKEQRFLDPKRNVPRTIYTAAQPGDAPDSGGGSPAAPSQVVITTAVSPTGAGTVSGGGTYASGTQVTLTATATAPETAPFTRWSDGVTQNPRTFTATTSQTFTALFGTQSGGGSGDDGMIGG